MGITARRVPDAILNALVLANNQKLTDSLSTFAHLDRTNKSEGADYGNPSITRLQITAAAATDLATSLVLLADIKSVVQKHFADTIAHDTAVSAQITVAAGTDLATAITLANDIKSKYSTHRSASGVHFTNDTTNATTAAVATDQATLDLLLNDLKLFINPHLSSAPTGSFINVVDA